MRPSFKTPCFSSTPRGILLGLKAYRFSFNGKEKIDEINGSGNDLDFGARIFDSRLGKWLSVDARFAKYPDLSPYVFSENNPLIMVDIGGDSSVYYTSAGVKLCVTHDNLSNAIVVVSDDQLYRWARNMRGFKSNGGQDGNVANEHLRKMGTVYLVGPLDQFYKENSKANLLKNAYISEANITIDHLEVGGKKISLYGEVKGNLVQEGNVVTVGTKTNNGGLYGSASPISEPGNVGTIHTHPSPRGVVVGVGKYSNVKLRFESGLSDTDKDASKSETVVAVDDKTIHLSTKDKPIAFDRNYGFKKK